MSLRPLIIRCIVPCLLLVLLTAASLAAQTKLDPEAAYKSMLDAIRTHSYEQFTTQADRTFKERFTPKMFAELSRRLGPKLQSGYTTTFLTTLNQSGYVVYAWKISFSGGKDDYLMTMFVKDDKVSGLITR